MPDRVQELLAGITENYRPDQKRDHGRFADESSPVRDASTKMIDKANRSKTLLKWESEALKQVKIDPKAKDLKSTPTNERLVEQTRWLNSDTGRKLQNLPGFSVLDWATKNLTGSRLGHSSWVDRKTGFRYDFQASTAGAEAVFGKAPGRIIETAPDGVKRELRGPDYNLFKRNCQDAGTFLNKYLPKFQRMRRKELADKGRLSAKAEEAVTNDQVDNSWSDAARIASAAARKLGKKASRLLTGSSKMTKVKAARSAGALGRADRTVERTFRRSEINSMLKRAGLPPKYPNIPERIQRLDDIRAGVKLPTHNVQEMLQVINGGPGSGNHGHKGIPGHRGGSMPGDGSMPQGVTPSARMSLSVPQRAAITKRNATVTSSRATLLSDHAKRLESKYKSKILPASREQHAQLYTVHSSAANELRDAAMQVAAMKDQSASGELLDKSAWHEQRALFHKKKYSRKGAIGEFASKFGKSALEGAVGGSVDDVVSATGELAGGVARDVGLAYATGGISAISQGVRKRGQVEQQAQDYESRMAKKNLHGGAKQRVEVEARKIREQKRGFGNIGAGAAQKGASRARTILREEGARIAREGIGPQLEKRRRDQFADISGMPLDLGMKVLRGRRDKFREAADTYGLKAGNERRSGRSGRSGRNETAAERSRRLAEEDFARQAEDRARMEDGPLGNSRLARVLESITANSLGNVRRERLDGREYLVAPVRMIVPGVLAGSKGALYYPPEEVARNHQQWNGIPIVVNHPTQNGLPVSARSPKILNDYGIGFIFNTDPSKGPLDAEAWVDVKKCQAVNQSVLRKIEAGQRMELSTGLFTNNIPSQGVWNNRSYQYIARDYRPDHLAILTDSVGACSLADGCGVLVNKKEQLSVQIASLVSNLSMSGLKTGAEIAAGGIAGGVALKTAFSKKPRTPKPRTPKPRTPKPRTPKPRIPKPKIAVPIANILKNIDGKTCVYSHKGKNLGGCGSAAKAKKRMAQVEYFKHVNNHQLTPRVQFLVDNLSTNGLVSAIKGAFKFGSKAKKVMNPALAKVRSGSVNHVSRLEYPETMVGGVLGSSKVPNMKPGYAAISRPPSTSQPAWLAPKPLPNAGKPAVQAQIVPTARPTPRMGSKANPVTAEVVKKPGLFSRIGSAIKKDFAGSDVGKAAQSQGRLGKSLRSVGGFVKRRPKTSAAIVGGAYAAHKFRQQ